MMELNYKDHKRNKHTQCKCIMLQKIYNGAGKSLADVEHLPKCERHIIVVIKSIIEVKLSHTVNHNILINKKQQISTPTFPQG